MKPTQAHARVAMGAVALVCAACMPAPGTASAGDVVVEDLLAQADEPILPLPEKVEVDARRAALGARLYGEPALSRDGSMSCATCHPLGRGAVDGLARSPVVGGGFAGVNTPTLYNVAFNFRFSWTGKQRTLEEQVEVALNRSMGRGADEAARTLAADPRWVEAFKDVFDEGPSGELLRVALAEFQRSLVTPRSPFDRWLRGDTTAMTPDQVRGWALFKELGCASCHQGRNAGGNMFQRMGIMGDYFQARGGPGLASDLGRFNETSREEDRHVFRVPSLRNVALTAPYLHDGHAPTLPDAVRIMARFQLGRVLTDDQVGLLVGFLQALTGEPPAQAPGAAP